MVVKNRKKTYTIVKMIIKCLYDKYLFMMENTIFYSNFNFNLKIGDIYDR